MKKYNQKGIALITVLVVAAIVMTLSGLAYQFLIKGTIISGLNLRYKEADSSLVAGAQYTKWVINQYRTTGSVPTTLPFGASDSSCLSKKLNEPINNWGSCPKTADPVNNYDIKLSLGTKNYTVYAEIINTLKGNTKAGGSASLNTGAVSAGKTGTNVVIPPTAPYLYRIELVAVKSNDVHSKVSALFGY